MISEHTIILLVYAAAILPALRCIRTSRYARAWLLAAPPIAVYLVSSLVFAVLLSAMLEAPYFQRAFPAAEGEAIVVLTSKVYDPDVERPLPLAGEDTYERTLYAAWLYHNWHPLPVLASGGHPPGGGSAPYAEAVRRVLLSQGVPDPSIWLETESRNTFESARNCAAMLHSKGVRKIVLVTEAYHMLRSERAFRLQGLEVVPAPCGFRSRGHFRGHWLLPDSRALAWTEDGLHEILGLGWYLIRHRI